MHTHAKNGRFRRRVWIWILTLIVAVGGWVPKGVAAEEMTAEETDPIDDAVTDVLTTPVERTSSSALRSTLNSMRSRSARTASGIVGGAQEMLDDLGRERDRDGDREGNAMPEEDLPSRRRRLLGWPR